MDNQGNKSNSNFGYIALGVGIGGAIGGGTAYLIARKKLKKAKAQLEELKKARKRAYLRGIEDATEEAQKWIDEHVKVINAADPESAQRAISEAFNDAGDNQGKEEESSSEGSPSESKPSASEPSPDILPSPESPQKTPVKESDDSIGYADDIYAEKPEESDEPKETVGEDEIGFRFHDKLLKYPRKLFFDENGETLAELDIRANLKDYEDDPVRIRQIWLALGFGEYHPEDEDESDADIDDYDLSIEGDEPEIKSEERERYLEQVKRYNDNPNEGPRIVSKKEFDEECYLGKTYIDYYAVDNVFVENLDIDSPIDAVTLLGVSDGDYLFNNKPTFDPEDDDNDPDIVHVRNFKMNTIAEVTRLKKAYKDVKDGSVYLDGDTDQGGGA